MSTEKEMPDAPQSLQAARIMLKERYRAAAGRVLLTSAERCMFDQLAPELLAGHRIVMRICPCGCGAVEVTSVHK